PATTDVQSFCQKLMDYLSAGHFEMYERIVSECAVNGHDSRKLVDSLTPKISASTDVALEFNDKYAEVTDEQWTAGFDQD
ncbi:Rsd/AlgQ family anti-sigma factor, partial [Klebsiella pneumoniae]|uniref:Rsd/AlgQ family anti-sigma factor n=1 Tax=Klebsiella pneumoniae TaxID=573 RepID=UPI003FD1B5F4